MGQQAYNLPDLIIAQEILIAWHSSQTDAILNLPEVTNRVRSYDLGKDHKLRRIGKHRARDIWRWLVRQAMTHSAASLIYSGAGEHLCTRYSRDITRRSLSFDPRPQRQLSDSFL